ncbi:winged helix-turn-helix domain-containing protein [Azospirillum sp. TSO35-2]|uniref:ATP-binding protein n=1 Tax=Azospirillum sp. TSO35-2 TaxID=716796 RepID=UPI000D61D974|nr:winged helix-turn-helix domain-containing protein [Azospirillum sp. TSO35-2]PWC32899.1 hypothetical protein TSO352_20095 [Azospirillum sp. TSO35-2]
MADDSRVFEQVRFGPFRLSSAERLLTCDGVPVAIGSRSLDILIALVERAGDVLSRRELIDRVWPDLVVEEANLRVHILGLRRALGDGQDGARYVTNIPGRGYCFVAPVRRERSEDGPQPPAPQARSRAAKSLPARLGRMIGREADVAALSRLLMARRFVSVLGAGGLGKTTVAVAIAHALLDEFQGEAFFIDLSALGDGALLPSAVAAAVGLQIQEDIGAAGLLAALADRRLLLLLDSCEHIVDAAAALAEILFAEAPGVHLLVTSREALRVEGEQVHLLHPLGIPAQEDGATAETLLATASGQLFMERADAAGSRSALTDEDAPVVAGICRRLDGIALAIELVASRVGTYGIRGTADLLDGRLKLLWQGRRNAVPRHQTLQAMLDWSYALLSSREQRVLRRLSVFVGFFTHAAVRSVATDECIDDLEVTDAVEALVDKSLISACTNEGTLCFRLLDTTRAYAAVKLAESGEGPLIARRHAGFCLDGLAGEGIDPQHAGGREPGRHAPDLSNVRAALEWAFSPEGDRPLAVRLAAHAMPLFLGLSFLGECRRWCGRALAALAEEERGTPTELALNEGLAVSAMFTRGNSVEVRAAIERGLDLAEALGDWNHQLHLLAGLHIYLTRIGDYQGALDCARRSVQVAGTTGRTGALAMADWMLGCTYHLVGDQDGAQRHCEIGFGHVPVDAPIDMGFFGYDHRVRALIVLARTLWLRGYPDRAAQTSLQAIAVAERRDHPVTLCIALIYTATVALWSGEDDLARERIERLLASAARHSLGPYHAVGQALEGARLIALGDAAAGVAELRNAMARLQVEQHEVLGGFFSRALAEGLMATGDLAEANAIAGAAIVRAEQGGAVDAPDLMRVRAAILLAGPRPDVDGAEGLLTAMLDLARRQSAASWELRAATALSRLWLRTGRGDEARALLTQTLSPFTEGFATADLRAAEGVLAQALDAA